MQLPQIKVLFCLVTSFKNIINNHVLHSPNRSLTSAKKQLSAALEETTLSLREDAKEMTWEGQSEEFSLVSFTTTKLQIQEPVSHGTINFKFPSHSVHILPCAVPIYHTSLHSIKRKPVATTKAITSPGVLRLSWNSSYRRERSQDFNSILGCQRMRWIHAWEVGQASWWICGCPAQNVAELRCISINRVPGNQVLKKQVRHIRGCSTHWCVSTTHQTIMLSSSFLQQGKWNMGHFLLQNHGCFT